MGWRASFGTAVAGLGVGLAVDYALQKRGASDDVRFAGSFAAATTVDLTLAFALAQTGGRWAAVGTSATAAVVALPVTVALYMGGAACGGFAEARENGMEWDELLPHEKSGIPGFFAHLAYRRGYW